MVAVKFSNEFFFDKAKVINSLKKGERRALSKIGAFVRTRARRSLRRRKKVSDPGSPPHVHSKHKVRSLKYIFFQYSPTTRDVIIGPVKLDTSTVGAGKRIKTSKTHPALMEYGGVAMVPGRWRDGVKKTVPARYPERPFMQPALEAERKAGTIIQAWRDSMR